MFHRGATVAFSLCCETECQRVKVCEVPARACTSSPPAKPRSINNTTGNARPPPVHSYVVLVTICTFSPSLSLSLFFCMNSSLACADILIPPPNPPNIFIGVNSSNTRAVLLFPLPPLPAPFPFAPLIAEVMVIIARQSKGQKDDARLPTRTNKSSTKQSKRRLNLTADMVVTVYDSIMEACQCHSSCINLELITSLSIKHNI